MIKLIHFPCKTIIAQNSTSYKDPSMVSFYFLSFPCNLKYQNETVSTKQKQICTMFKVNKAYSKHCKCLERS